MNSKLQLLKLLKKRINLKAKPPWAERAQSRFTWMRPLGPESLEGACLFQGEGIIDYITVIDTSKSAREAAILADEIKPDFDGVDADLVIIATPSNLHASQARELLSKGYHVLVEKLTWLFRIGSRTSSSKRSRVWQDFGSRSAAAVPSCGYSSKSDD